MTIGTWGRIGAMLVLVAFGTNAGAQGLSHWPEAGFHDSFEGVANAPAADSDAVRFLTQATFGATYDEITHLRDIGYQN